MADPEEYRSKEDVEEWRKRDPINVLKSRLVDDGMLSEDDAEKLDQKAMERVDAAVEFADNSPFPDLDSLYDDIYVYGEQVRGWYSVDERAPEPHRGEHERDSGVIAHELAEAGAAYAGVGDAEERARRSSKSSEEEEDD
jgi:hypothetical protein